MAKDREFGIPEQKKFPLDSEEHVRSAIRFFNYADPAYEKELASKIISKIHEYNITGLTPSASNRFYKYYHPNDAVAHHGIIGMHWGDRNGPPYPLSGAEHAAVTKQAKGRSGSGNGQESSKVKRKMSWGQKRRAKKNLAKAREAAAQKRLDDKEKEKLVSEGSAQDIYARRNELTNEQKQRAVQRLNLDQQLAQYSANERAKKKSTVDKLLNAGEKVSKGINTAYGIANGINNFNKLINGDSDKEAERAKKKAIQSSDVNELLKYAGKLSSSDYNEFVNVAKSNKDIKDYKAGKKTLDDLGKNSNKNFNVDNMSNDDLEKLKKRMGL